MKKTESNLTKKLVKILGEAQKVKKSGMNTYAGYQYTTESDLLELLRPKLVEAGIFIFSSVIEARKEGEITTVLMEHTFVDSETGEEKIIRSAGQGSDKQDKGVYKALTGSMKYMLWKNFLIESNDDPENDNANPGYLRGKEASTKKVETKATNKTFAAPKIAAKTVVKEELKVEPKVEPKVEQKKESEGNKPRTFGNRTFKTQTGEAKF